MGDHLVVCVDRLITSDNLQSAKGTEVSESSGETHIHVAESSNSLEPIEVGEDGVPDEEQPLIQLFECRICQEEDSAKNLEVPCACSGSLKTAAELEKRKEKFKKELDFVTTDVISCLSGFLHPLFLCDLLLQSV